MYSPLHHPSADFDDTNESNTIPKRSDRRAGLLFFEFGEWGGAKLELQELPLPGHLRGWSDIRLLPSLPVGGWNMRKK